MKTLFTALLMALTTTVSVHAQTSLLTHYYQVKEALVNGDAATASSKAADLVKAAGNWDLTNTPTGKTSAVSANLKKLGAAAQSIADNKNIARQREYFADLSNEIYLLAKSVKLSDQTIYQAYCPMKKAYWLSNENSIRNPYYGQLMPGCGSISASIKP